MHKKDKHIKHLVIDLLENKLSDEKKRSVKNHLNRCGECGVYYNQMQKILTPAGTDILPELDPDPFLPTRVKANAQPKNISKKNISTLIIRWSLITAASFAAILIGILLGTRLSKNQAAYNNREIITAYSEAFYPQGIGDKFEYTLYSKGVEEK